MDERDVAVLGEDLARLAQERLPALAVAAWPEAGDAGAELAGSARRRAACPRGRSSPARRGSAACPRGRTSRSWRARGSRAARARSGGPRAAPGRWPGSARRDRRSASARRPTCAARPRRGAPRRSPRPARQRVDAAARGARRPAPGRRTGSSPTSCRSSASGQQRERKPQPPHLLTPTCSSGSSSLSRKASISSAVASASVPPSYSTWRISPLPGMDLERDRRLAEGLLVEPAVGLELQLRRAPGRGRPGGSASSRGSRSRGGRGAGSRARRRSRSRGRRGSRSRASAPGRSRSRRRSTSAIVASRCSSRGSWPMSTAPREPLEVAALVLDPEPHQHLREGARRILLDPLLAQPHPQPAARRLQVAVEVAREQPRLPALLGIGLHGADPFLCERRGQPSRSRWVGLSMRDQSSRGGSP